MNLQEGVAPFLFCYVPIFKEQTTLNIVLVFIAEDLEDVVSRSRVVIMGEVSDEL